eukprot:TRINITY_DN8813_c0_g4_i4.p1 TRINITY_DN8813_c0_g4~~TRINITY_DN8813_c0_g4_i4.p1  ORF type:complete len:125 (-),score=36.19 TRINITY_DN8813_c0_g4_i4:179-523(-)
MGLELAVVVHHQAKEGGTEKKLVDQGSVPVLSTTIQESQDEKAREDEAGDDAEDDAEDGENEGEEGTTQGEAINEGSEKKEVDWSRDRVTLPAVCELEEAKVEEGSVPVLQDGW